MKCYPAAEGVVVFDPVESTATEGNNADVCVSVTTAAPSELAFDLRVHISTIPGDASSVHLRVNHMISRDALQVYGTFQTERMRS